ncbi:endothelin-converting enzyme [Paecilomyces variotii]|uniref:Endothelin-converting enzyme n=1 Tax=Byssochlamys spectabilis TaxID=264951 RepID=A0A443I545_BYSSP|nr:endothelin-converting enzyme [Paecilomyces variotii]KAJ9360622.1 hypothetical protein DTO280E4_4339 [Paecilomyces variotii]RWQ99213.1 endothelin-converting enzyme [Paecilomyces variotii]
MTRGMPRSQPLRLGKWDASDDVPALADGEKSPLVNNADMGINDGEPWSPTIVSRSRVHRRWSKLLWFTKWATVIAIIGYLSVKNSVLSGIIQNSGLQANAPSVCDAAECVHAASEILYNLHPNYKNIDPCEDFEQYVCGGWQESHDMRSDQGSLFAGTIMAENAQSRVRHILESSEVPGDSKSASIKSSADSEIFEELKTAYNACIDECTVAERGVKPLEDVLSQIEKTYPTGKSSSSDPRENLTEVIQYLVEIGVEALVSPYVSADDRDPDSVAIFVTPPREIGLPTREYYNNTKTVEDYKSVVERVLAGFHALFSPDGTPSPLDSSVLSQLSNDIITFETKLANATPDTQTQEDVTQYYNPRTIKQTHSLLPEISFSDIISSLAPEGFQTDRLIVGSPSYMKDLSAILQETPRATIQSFLKWKVIQAFSTDVEDPILQPLREFNNRLQGKDPQAKEERWRKCVRAMDNGLPWILSRFYVLDAFPEESKKLGDQIVSDIKERFIFTLDQTQWMTAEVRKLGIQKVENIVQKIGYPTQSPNVLDPENIKGYYQGLKLSDGKFFENQLNIAKFDVRKQWSKLGKPTDRGEWGMSVPTVNAYYNPPGNEIVFPAGIMQKPVFYGPSAPLYLSYGAFGAVSGHELSHAFDSTGRHYDQTGNYTDWWDKKTVEEFEKRAQCFIDQYSNFTVPGPEPDSEPLHVNGRLTLGENIADAGGLTAAYHAWQKRDSASPDPKLPGLGDFTKEQLFFVSYANWWCSKTTREAAVRAIYSDPHAPKPARIIGTMANSREFKEAFSCPKKEPVCKLW